MSEPIEIRPEDIIKRPFSPTPRETAGGLNLSKITKQVKEAKELIQALQESGIQDLLGGMGIQLPGKPAPAGQSSRMPATSPSAPAITMKQVIGFMQLLKMRYGDIPISEAAANLKRDYSDVDLSALGGK